MHIPSTFRRAAALALTLSLGGTVRAAEITPRGDAAARSVASPAIGARADDTLRSMGDYLAAVPEFTFRAEITYDVVSLDGQKIQYGGVASVAVHRPDRLHVIYDGDERPRQVVISGKRVAMLDREANVYARASVPPELGAAIDHIFDTHGFSVPIADLVYPDPYEILTEGVESGSMIGRHAVDGVPCHHLAFSQEAIDWQIWIEDGPAPLPRKLVITYKTEPGSPQYSATLSQWNLEPRVAPDYFEFRPPVGSDVIGILPEQPAEGQE
jgi:hypothetical protein